MPLLTVTMTNYNKKRPGIDQKSVK